MRSSWARTVAATLLPVAAAFGIELFYWAGDVRWSLFYIAVFFSSWIGGFVSGLSATILSTMIVWWFFTSPRYHIVKHDARHYLAAIAFLAVGYLICVLHRRVRRGARELAVALLDSRALAERLEHVVDERRVFSALIENCTDFIGISDPDGNVVYVNPAGRRMIELPPDFALDTISRADFYPLGLRPVPDLIAKELLETGRWRGETRLRNWRTGESIPVSDTQFLIRDQETDRLLGIGMIARDMSAAQRQRQEMEATNHRLSQALRDLENSRRYLQAILDHSPNGIVIKSLDGRYLVINKGLESLTNVTAANSLGKTDFDLFPPGVAERFRANDSTVLASRAPLITEERPNGEDGRVMLVSKFPLLDEHDDVFAICAIWVDITEHKRTEEAMRQSARDLRAAQHVARVGSWHWDRRTGVNTWSDELYEIFGLDSRQPPPPMLQKGSRVLTPASREQLQVLVDKLFANGEPYEIDLEVICPDGTRRWVSAHGEAVRDDNGNIIGMDGTAADITHLKALQRMREEWTSVIAHDLRQPIGVIAMASNFLPTLHGGRMSAEERDFMKRIQSATTALARMVDDLLDMSLLEANRLKLERKWIDPASIVTDAVDRTMHTAGTKKVRVSAPRQLPQIYVDPMRIEQVLGNLLSNAVKYGDKEHDILVRVDRYDGAIEVSVTNHGKGIDPAELPRLFDRFARSKATRGTGVPGLGLGLYISKGVIEAHGGRLWAESVPGQTTAFHFSLPIATATKEAA